MVERHSLFHERMAIPSHGNILLPGGPSGSWGAGVCLTEEGFEGSDELERCEYIFLGGAPATAGVRVFA